jgi:hypoxanthine phosphoribosyltransferase
MSPLALDEHLEEVIGEDRIVARVAELGHAIAEEYHGRPLNLVVVLKGAFVFAADLVRRIETLLTLDFVTASSYRDGIHSTGKVALNGIHRLDLEGRHVLVVEDILDTGHTAAAVLAAVRERRPASLGLCALLRKPRARLLDLPVTAVGFDIADDFVVGYGMDYAERYRNLPSIYRLVFDHEQG